MSCVYEAEDWKAYQQKMDYKNPHQQLELLEAEIEIVDTALDVLVTAGILAHRDYDGARFLEYRAAVRDRYEIPWTAITPRMQRLIYAVNVIAQPQVMVAVGIFCGNTFSINAGAAIGPGACYRAERLVGLEIRPEEADRARRNVATIDPEGQAEILGEDGIAWVQNYEGTIDLLYLDADGPMGKGKSIYLDLVQAADRALRPGSLV
ncbi:MAG: hypothetical protein QGG64_15275, partial [Candidatus Latescibacteria bacterium]|nr:hypothetical protein [Candidatus Latescibacterota bacterium]